MEEIVHSVCVSDSEVTLTPKNHQYTLIWLNGLGEEPQKALEYLFSREIGPVLSNFRVVLPRSRKMYVKAINATTNSWFNIKMKGELAILVEASEAVDVKGIEEVYEQRLRPILEREFIKMGSKAGRLFIGGFSQGCIMAYHCFYSCSLPLAGVLGVSGQILKITPFSKDKLLPKRHIHGLSDKTREWRYNRISFDDRFSPEEIVLIEGMGHDITLHSTKMEIAKFLIEVIQKIQPVSRL